MIQNMTIAGVDVLKDLGIYIKSRSIQLPEPKNMFVEVPGADGVLDLSTALTGGDLKFEDRLVTVEFTSVNNYMDARDKLAKLLHGRSPDFYFHDDADFYFRTRRSVLEEWEYDEDGIPTFTVVFQTLPYRYKRELTRVEFSNDGSALVLANGRMKTYPTFTSSRDMLVRYSGREFSLHAGEPRELREIPLFEGETSVRLSGSGKVVVEYQEGEL